MPCPRVRVCALQVLRGGARLSGTVPCARRSLADNCPKDHRSGCEEGDPLDQTQHAAARCGRPDTPRAAASVRLDPKDATAARRGSGSLSSTLGHPARLRFSRCLVARGFGERLRGWVERQQILEILPVCEVARGAGVGLVCVLGKDGLLTP